MSAIYFFVNRIEILLRLVIRKSYLYPFLFKFFFRNLVARNSFIAYSV